MKTLRYPDLKSYKGLLLALWISIGLHAALIAMVKIVPPPSVSPGHTIEARLMPGVQHAKLALDEEIPLWLPEPHALALDDMLAYAPPPSEPPGSVNASSPRPAEPPSLPQIEIPLAVDLHYYNARELDITPSADIAEPELPASVSGKIQYRVKIEADGRVSDVEVIRAELSPDNDAAALASTEAVLRATRFQPGIRAGRAVRTVVVYELMINPLKPAPR